MKEFIKTPEPPEPEPVQQEEEGPAQTVMSLAFQAALKDNNGKKKQRDIEKLISASLKR